MRRRHLESVSAVLYGRCFGSFVFSRSLAAKRFAKGKARFPFALFCFLLQEQKEGPRGERCQLSRCKRLRLAARRPQTIPTPEAEKGNRGADMGEKGGKLNKKA